MTRAAGVLDTGDVVGQEVDVVAVEVAAAGRSTRWCGVGVTGQDLGVAQRDLLPSGADSPNREFCAAGVLDVEQALSSDGLDGFAREPRQRLLGVRARLAEGEAGMDGRRHRWRGVRADRVRSSEVFRVSLGGGTVQELLRDQDAAQVARAHVRSFCAALGPDLIETATLLVTEVVTNALAHAQGRIVLRLTHERSHLLVEVTDGSAELEVKLRPPSLHALGGRGLVLVDRLAGSWGVLTAAPTKTVWFTLPWSAS